MKNDEFLYKSEFTSIASFRSLDKFSSKASISELEDLKKLIGDKDSVNNDPDLLYTVFNCAVVNLVNKNGDAIDTETALNIAKYFKHKPTNIEHDINNVVGYITNVGFSSYPENLILNEESLSGTSRPFNIALSAILWRSVDPFFTRYLEDSNDENNYCYKDVSTSWEIGFNEYKIAVGSKNLQKAKIISDKAEIEVMKKHLVKFGGTGFNEENEEVYMVISGEARPLGIGFTTNPAASVSGVLVVNEDEDEEEEEINSKSSIDALSLRVKDLEEKILSQKISQKDKNTVIQYKSMKFENLDELYSCLSEASSIEASDASSIKNFIKDELTKADEKWKTSQKEKEDKEIALKEALANVTKITEQLQSVQAKFDSLQAEVQRNTDQATFDKRINELDSKYEMSAKLVAHISESIFGKNEEEYNDWLSKAGSVILEGKERETPSTPEGALEVSTASKGFVPNASTEDKKEEEVTKKPIISRKGNLFEIKIS